MTREEKRIWQAAYGAAYALRVNQDRQKWAECLDAAIAIETADSAVAALRDRRATGDARAGVHIWEKA